MSNIHNYPIESLTFGDDDFYDIDFFNGSGYETRKIKGSTIKAGIAAASGSIYEQDGTFTGNRILNGGGFTWANLDVKAFFMQLVPDAALNALGYDIDSTNMNPADAYLLISDTATGQDILKITKDKQFVIFDEYALPQVDGTSGQIIKTDGAGVTEFASTQDLASVNFGSTQWSKTIGIPVDLLNGQVANGFTFFDNVLDKVAGGTTGYDEYDITFGISIILDVANTSGTANINILGVDYPMTFATDNFTTVSNWLGANEATLNALNVRVFRLGSGTDGRLRFCAAEAILNGITFTNLTGDIAATIQNEFTGSATASPDHVLVPYVGTAYEGQRIQHNFRVNFGIVTGSAQTYGLSLKRYEDDSIIGSEIPVNRNQDVEGVQQNFISYTAGATDPFVEGGFYFALRNDSGATAQITSGIGILIQNYYQKLTQF